MCMHLNQPPVVSGTERANGAVGTRALPAEREAYYKVLGMLTRRFSGLSFRVHQ